MSTSEILIPAGVPRTISVTAVNLPTPAVRLHFIHLVNVGIKYFKLFHFRNTGDHQWRARHGLGGLNPQNVA